MTPFKIAYARQNTGGSVQHMAKVYHNGAWHVCRFVRCEVPTEASFQAPVGGAPAFTMRGEAETIQRRGDKIIIS